MYKILRALVIFIFQDDRKTIKQVNNYADECIKKLRK